MLCTDQPTLGLRASTLAGQVTSMQHPTNLATAAGEQWDEDF
jgi:hypothetical protein